MLCSLVLQLLKYFCTIYQASISIAFQYSYKIKAFRKKNFDDIHLLYFQN